MSFCAPWFVLRWIFPRQDTDSIIISAASANFADLVKPEFEVDYPRIAAQLFEDPLSDREQSALLKVRRDLEIITSPMA